MSIRPNVFVRSRFRQGRLVNVDAELEPHGERPLQPALVPMPTSTKRPGGQPDHVDDASARQRPTQLGNAATARAAPSDAGTPATPGNAAVAETKMEATDVMEAVAGKKTLARKSATVTITNVSGPKDLGRGGFEWKVWFSIGSPAGADGWVIQEVMINRTIVDAKGITTTKNYHYWEAWELKKGKTVTVWQDGALDDNDDMYHEPNGPTGSKGTIEARGKVKFYEGALPADFKTNNPSTLAGILHSTTTKPTFWDGSGTTHDLTSTWDDTVSPPTHSVIGVAGGTKLKGTP